VKKMSCLLVFFCSFPVLLAAQIGIYQHGTVVRMHMGDCVSAHRGFMVAFGGPAMPASEDVCPEYTLVSPKVVYVIVGKFSNQLIPLAESIDFRLHNNELAVRVDDARHESKFMIKEMIVRSEWDRVQRHIQEAMNTSENRKAERVDEQ